MAVVVAEDGSLAPIMGQQGTTPSTFLNMVKSPNGRRFGLMIAAAAIIAVMVGLVLWSQKPEYRVLFSNFSDRDGGAIMASLQAANIPYKFAEGGSAILVPADKVHEVRLKLAAEGLPKGGNVGFELMENQKLGVSQFLEQVNFQRALEGELARSIESLAAVQGARVHLAMPKASVFVRDQQKPTASVLLNLRSGRMLDQQQVSAIVHLVASSVPELSPKNVTVVDEAGNLLSDNGKLSGSNALDPAQIKYVQDLQQSIAKRVESIISPMVGAENVRAEATVDVDFSTTQQAAEIYKPNQVANSATIRSQQISESDNNAGKNASGVPGALTNQPAPSATAPLTAAPTTPATPTADGQPAGTAGTAAGASTATAEAKSTPTQRDVTTNYEVDKTLRYVQQPMGGLKRVSVAVVVNYKRNVGKDGKVTITPLSDVEKTQITNLVKQAMGYNADRGDTLNVVNSPFAGVDRPEAAKLPLWQQPKMIDLALQVAKYIGIGIVLLLLYFKALKPMLAQLKKPEVIAPSEEELEKLAAKVTLDASPMHAAQNYQQTLEAAKALARDDPKVVANIIKSWVGNDG